MASATFYTVVSRTYDGTDYISETDLDDTFDEIAGNVRDGGYGNRITAIYEVDLVGMRVTNRTLDVLNHIAEQFFDDNREPDEDLRDIFDAHQVDYPARLRGKYA